MPTEELMEVSAWLPDGGDVRSSPASQTEQMARPSGGKLVDDWADKERFILPAEGKPQLYLYQIMNFTAPSHLPDELCHQIK